MKSTNSSITGISDSRARCTKETQLPIRARRFKIISIPRFQSRLKTCTQLFLLKSHKIATKLAGWKSRLQIWNRLTFAKLKYTTSILENSTTHCKSTETLQNSSIKTAMYKPATTLKKLSYVCETI